jgi:cell division protein FtsA
MMTQQRCLAGLDVGSETTCAVLIELSVPWGEGDVEARVLGVGEAPTAGVRNRVVTNMDAAVESIRAALRKAEEMAGAEATVVYAGIAGDHVEVDTSTGVVAISGREITPRDLDHVHEVARAVVVPADRELLHAIPQDYVVDGVSGVQDPTGMAAMRLESEVCVVTAGSVPAQNLRKAIDRAGWKLEELVLAPLATNLAVLSEEQRRAGVVLVEIGAAATEVLAFKDERLRLFATLPWGGATVTSDIVKGLGVPVATAELLKAEHGSAQTKRVDAAESLEIPGPTPGTVRTVSRELLAHIIEQRLDEMLGLIYDELESRDLLDSLNAGVVLAGGAARLDGVVELAQEVFNLPVALGEPGFGLTGLVDTVRRPECATAVGLALYGRHRRAERPVGSAMRAIGRVTDWIKEFF